MKQSKYIPITQGEWAIVDAEDFDKLSAYSWHVTSCGYAMRVERIDKKRGNNVLMHRQIMNCPSGKVVDHINRNRLDNRRENLRICSYSENARNRSASTVSGYVGVSKAFDRYISSIRVNERNVTLGRWLTPQEAARAHDSVAIYLKLEFAPLNFSRQEITPKSVGQVRLEAKRAYKKVKTRGACGLSGVCKVKSGRFQANINVSRKDYCLGWYATPEAAAEAYDAASKFLFGEDAKLNFPSRDIAPMSPEDLRKQARTRKKHSQYRGVFKNCIGKWSAAITRNGKRHPLGTYEEETAAALAADAASLFFGDDRSLLNFPDLFTVGMPPILIRKVAPSFVRSASQYRGVHLNSKKTRWVAVYGRSKYCGEYDTPEEAARAYDATAYAEMGVSACLNFPSEAPNASAVRSVRPRSGSGYWGVIKRGERFEANAEVGGKVVYVGVFDTAEAAALARDAKAKELGTPRYLNFV